MLTGQQHLFSASRPIEELARNAADKIRTKLATDQSTEKSDAAEPTYQQVDVASMQASQLRSLGAEYVCQCIWNENSVGVKS